MRSQPSDVNDDPIDMIEGQSGYADVSTNDLSRDMDGNSDSEGAEDDVDMEWDIHDRLAALWPGLPEDWDILYLGVHHATQIS